MIYRLLLAALCVVFFSVNAEARQRHKPTELHPECNVTMPCEAPMSVATVKERQRVARGEYIARQLGWGGVNPKRVVKTPKARQPVAKISVTQPTYGAPSPSIGYTIAKPLTFIAGRLVCAVNVGAALAERGIKGTGSALAMSYRTWGRSAGGPVPGAVIVSRRRGGGHVAIVSRVQNGVVYAWNATGGRNGWREIPYRKAVIDYRVPG